MLYVRSPAPPGAPRAPLGGRAGYRCRVFSFEFLILNSARPPSRMRSHHDPRSESATSQPSAAGAALRSRDSDQVQQPGQGQVVQTRPPALPDARCEIRVTRSRPRAIFILIPSPSPSPSPKPLPLPLPLPGPALGTATSVRDSDEDQPQPQDGSDLCWQRGRGTPRPANSGGTPAPQRSSG